MLPNADQINAVHKMLKKLGQASVTVTRVPYASDRKFSDQPPSCHVTLTATDPTDSKFSYTRDCDLFGKEPPENTNTFIIPVKGGLKFWHKGRTLHVHILAEPDQGYQDTHEPMTIDLEGVVAGDERRKSVSLKPKNEGDQQEKNTQPPDKRLHC
jgi:hypothetical protein